MKKELARGPISLDDYVRLRRRRRRKLRQWGATALAAGCLLLRLLWPQGAGMLRARLTGDGRLERSASAFYHCLARGDGLEEAVEVFCEALD